MENIRYSELLRRNKELESIIESKKYKIKVLSNITVNQTKEILEYNLRIEGINANIEIGDYDNIVQDSTKVADSQAVIIFWEICNIVEGLFYKIEHFEDSQITELGEKVCSEIDLVFKNLEQSSLVLINKFSSLPFQFLSKDKSNLDKFTEFLNKYLEDTAPKNVRLIEINKIFANVELSKSIDFRYYYSSKALYTIEFLKNYANQVKPLIMSANGKAKKTIIFDCDNTLWKGILGEDGFDKIDMSSHSKAGIVFHEIQNLALSLYRQGVLICLCSKNNESDVDLVLQNHPDMLIKEKHITIKKVNWNDKATNIRQIAIDLNIGLDSLVFVDDSSFEINLIKEQIPEVTLLQVPEKLYLYPQMLRANLGLFYNLSLTEEDKVKSLLYQEQNKRQQSKSNFSDIEDYLASLELNLKWFKDDQTIIPRMSQMTQKTNQFNLTTIRYTESDISKLITSSDYQVYAWSVSDKFGDNGITGLCIVNMNTEQGGAEIDTFLMSCRIIGRNIEYSFMDLLIEDLRNQNVESLTAKHIYSSKNEQVKDFYSKSSFELLKETNKDKKYKLELKNYKTHTINYIKLENGNKN
jgi:FkbH-like protein